MHLNSPLCKKFCDFNKITEKLGHKQLWSALRKYGVWIPSDLSVPLLSAMRWSTLLSMCEVTVFIKRFFKFHCLGQHSSASGSGNNSVWVPRCSILIIATSILQILFCHVFFFPQSDFIRNCITSWRIKWNFLRHQHSRNCRNYFGFVLVLCCFIFLCVYMSVLLFLFWRTEEETLSLFLL